MFTGERDWAGRFPRRRRRLRRRERFRRRWLAAPPPAPLRAGHAALARADRRPASSSSSTRCSGSSSRASRRPTAASSPWRTTSSPTATPRGLGGARSTRCSTASRSRCSPSSSPCRSPGRCRAPTCRPRAWSALLILGAFITPPYLGAIGWILLAGPNAGWLNRIWMALTGSAARLLQHLFASPASSSSSRSTPSPTCSSSPPTALDLVSSEMEDAANILGAGTLRTIFRVTLPLVTAGDPRRRDHHFPRSDRAVRHAGADRPAGALQGRDHCSSGSSSRYPVRVEVAAAYAMPLLADHRRAVLAAAPGARPPGLRRGDRQGRRAAPDRSSGRGAG